MIKWLSENFDISRQEDADFMYVYLHGETHVHYDAIKCMQNFQAFAGIDLRDGCLCVRVLKASL